MAIIPAEGVYIVGYIMDEWLWGGALKQTTTHEVYRNDRMGNYEVYDMDGYCVTIQRTLEAVLVWAMENRTSMYKTITLFPMLSIRREI